MKLQPCFIGIFTNKASQSYEISVITKEQEHTFNLEFASTPTYELLTEDIENYIQANQLKIIACGLEKNTDQEFIDFLWLRLDATPVYFPIHDGEQNISLYLAQKIRDEFEQDRGLFIHNLKIDAKNKVHSTRLTTMQPYYVKDTENIFYKLGSAADTFKARKKKAIFINATPRGGGVAIMRHAMMRLYDLQNLHISWHVLQPNQEAFVITKKKFHNVLQGVNPPDVYLTNEDKKIYNTWIKQNYEFFKPLIKDTDYIVIDDAQPSGLIPFIKKDFPTKKIIFRSHIQIDTERLVNKEEPISITWDFIWNENQVKEADIFVSHPVESFVPSDVPKDKLIYLHPSSDYLDGLTKKIHPHDAKYYLDIFNYTLEQDEQTPLDVNRPYIIQIARFDPSKGIDDVLTSYVKLLEKLKHHGNAEKPQLVIAGHGSVDDPEGIPILQSIKYKLESSDFAECKNDIKVARLPSNDQVLSTLMQGAHVYMQLSHREGYEFNITEALNKGIPCIIYNAGGMPLQIIPNKNAYKIEIGDTEKVADHLYELFINPKLRIEMAKNAKELVSYKQFTPFVALKWLEIFNGLEVENPTI